MKSLIMGRADCHHLKPLINFSVTQHGTASHYQMCCHENTKDHLDNILAKHVNPESNEDSRYNDQFVENLGFRRTC